MRNTSLVTISLPPALQAESEKAAQKQNMTRSEFFRAAMREYINKVNSQATKKKIAWEEKHLAKAIKAFEREQKAGKLKVLPPGGLASLMKK